MKRRRERDAKRARNKALHAEVQDPRKVIARLLGMHKARKQHTIHTVLEPEPMAADMSTTLPR